MTKQELNEITEKYQNLLSSIDNHTKAVELLQKGFRTELAEQVQELKQFISKKEIEMQENEKLNNKEE